MHAKLLYLLISTTLLGNECREVIMQDEPCSTCYRKTIRTYTDCDDKTSYTDSVISNGKLESTGNMLHSKKEGAWNYFDYKGNIEQSYFFIQDKQYKMCQYYLGKLSYCTESYQLNDSVYFAKYYDSKNNLTSEGHIMVDCRIGEWIIYEENGDKAYENYIPISHTDSNFVYDTLTGITTIQVIGYCGLLNGERYVYDKNGNLILIEMYDKGLKIK
jgi:antitoxin component YwqK of YwqJK toxin-antitoxin module